jgi:hypothetical protein
MSLHGLFREIELASFRAFHSGTMTLIETIALLVVSLLFLAVGISRWVEFQDYGFSRIRKVVLIIMHLVGCVALAMAFAIQAVDLDRRFSAAGMGFLASALVLLFPIHIYLGLLRRVKSRPKAS